MLSQFGKVVAGIGALIALGLVLSNWKGTVEILGTAGTQTNNLVKTLSMQRG